MMSGYLEHLSQDKALLPILENAQQVELKRQQNLPQYLYRTIINQQLSTRVGQVILERFLNLFGGNEPTSQQVASIDFDTLKSIGLSKQKATYIQNVAKFDLENGINFESLSKMSDVEAIAYISSIKGIGKWTAELFLMFALGREDLFPGDDLILQKKVAELYGLDRSDKKKFLADMYAIAQNWSPFRTYASVLIWRS